MKVVFVHGFGCHAGDWSACIDQLSSELECLAVDLPGHGERATDDGPYTLNRAAQEIGDSLGDGKTVLVGHSMGTRIVTRIAAAYPQAVQALVLVDGSCVPVPLGKEADFVALHGLTRQQRKAVIERASNLPEEVTAGYTTDMTRWDAQEADQTIASTRCPARLLQSTNYTRPPDCRRLPIDQQPDSLWFDLWQRLPGTVIERISGAGHHLPVERPGDVAREIRAACSRP